jgi:CO dehydrogenase maturation factor
MSCKWRGTFKYMPKRPSQENSGKPLSSLRLLVCGKGGSGKSSVVALMARVLHDRGYKVLVLDGDASNPGGLARLLLGLKDGPKPLIEFFGGRKTVACPVDNPEPLTREGDTSPVTEKKIELTEIPSEYFVREEDIVLFQVGKIREACEGCDGPMSKVTRDFIVKGEQVTLIDVEAGIEHFGRGVERNIDVVFVVVDPTYESFMIAGKVSAFCRGLGVKRVWAVLNKVPSQVTESLMMNELKKESIKILGAVYEDPEVMKTGLLGTPLQKSKAMEDVENIVDRLEGALEHIA